MRMARAGAGAPKVPRANTARQVRKIFYGHLVFYVHAYKAPKTAAFFTFMTPAAQNTVPLLIEKPSLKPSYSKIALVPIPVISLQLTVNHFRVHCS